MNMALKRLNNEHTMLHYPLFVKESDSFIRRSKTLQIIVFHYCHHLRIKMFLEIGCGNGVQALYINSNYNPLRMTGIDLSKSNIEIAHSEKARTKTENVHFLVDDAQNMSQIKSDSLMYY